MEEYPYQQYPMGGTDGEPEPRRCKRQMSEQYMDILTKCKKCGKHYSRREQKKCPHNFKDKLSRQMAGQEKDNE